MTPREQILAEAGEPEPILRDGLEFAIDLRVLLAAERVIARQSAEIERLNGELNDYDGDRCHKCEALREKDEEIERWKLRHIDEGIRGGRAISRATTAEQERDTLRERVQELVNELGALRPLETMDSKQRDNRDRCDRMVAGMIPAYGDHASKELAELVAKDALTYLAAIDALIAENTK